MQFDARTVDVPTAGTRVQVLNDPRRVLWIRFHARAANVGLVYVGDTNVSATRGRALSPDGTVNALSTTEYNFGAFLSPTTRSPGGVAMSTFWVDTTTNGNDVDWEAIFV